MSVLEIPLELLDGTPTTLGGITAGCAALVVNVASRCGLTSQYTALESVHVRYQARGFTVIGVPCNQFRGQEPGSAPEIAEFCSRTYGVTFPLTSKTDVNGPDRHSLYHHLLEPRLRDDRGAEIRWNFEKFLVAGDGSVVARFDPMVSPDDPRVLADIEALLAEQDNPHH